MSGPVVDNSGASWTQPWQRIRRAAVDGGYHAWYSVQKSNGPSGYYYSYSTALITFVQLLSFAFDPQTSFPWNSAYTSWITLLCSSTRLSWHLRAQEQGFVHAQIVISTLLAVMFGLFGYAAFEQRQGGRDHALPAWLRRTLWTSTSLVTGIAFIPCMSILLLSVRDCNTDAECSSNAHSFRVICGIAFAGFLLKFSVLSALFTYFHFPSKSAIACANGRGDAARLLVHAGVSAGFAVMDVKKSHLPLCVLYVGSSIPMALVTTLYSPWINARYARLQAMLAFLHMWAAQCLLVTVLLNDRLDPGPAIFLWYASPLAAYLGRNCCALASTLWRIRSINKLSNAYQLEIKCRHYLEEHGQLLPENDETLDIAGGLSTDDVEGDESNSKDASAANTEGETGTSGIKRHTKGASKKNAIDQVHAWYEEALKGGMGAVSSSLWLVASRFFFDYLHNDQLGSIALTHASAAPAIDENFQIFAYRKRVEERFNAESGILLAHLEHSEQVLSSKLDILRAMVAQIRFWSALLQRQPDLRELHRVGTIVNRHVTAAHSRCRLLVSKRPDDASALRTYASLLIHVLNDPSAAVALVEQADRIDDLASSKTVNAGDLAAAAPLSMMTVDPEVTGIIHVSVDERTRGIIRKANAVACRLFGRRQAELVGANIKSLMPATVASSHDSLMNRFFRDAKANILNMARSVFAIHSSGSLIPLQMILRQMPISFERPEPLVMVCLQPKPIPTGELWAIVRHSTLRILNVTERWKSFFGVSTTNGELNIPITSVLTDFLYRENDYRNKDGAVFLLESNLLSASPSSPRRSETDSSTRRKGNRHSTSNSLRRQSQSPSKDRKLRKDSNVSHTAPGLSRRRSNRIAFDHNITFTVWIEDLKTPDLLMLRMLSHEQKSKTSVGVSVPPVPLNHSAIPSVLTPGLDHPNTIQSTPHGPLTSSPSSTIPRIHGAVAAAAAAVDITQIPKHARKRTRFSEQGGAGGDQSLLSNSQSLQVPAEESGEHGNDDVASSAEKDANSGSALLQGVRRRILSRRSRLEPGVIVLVVALFLSLAAVWTLASLYHTVVGALVHTYQTDISRIEIASTQNKDAVGLVFLATSIVLAAQTYPNGSAIHSMYSPMIEPIAENLENTQNLLFKSERDLKSVLGLAYASTYVNLTEMSSPSTGSQLFPRRLHVVDAFKAFVGSMRQLSRLGPADLSAGLTNKDVFFSLYPSNYLRIISALNRLTALRNLHTNDALDHLTRFNYMYSIAVAVLSISLTLFVLVPIIVRTERQRDIVLGFFLSLNRNDVKELRNQAIATLQEHIDPQDGIWADVLEQPQFMQGDIGLGLGFEEFGAINENLDLHDVEENPEREGNAKTADAIRPKKSALQDRLRQHQAKKWANRRMKKLKQMRSGTCGTVMKLSTLFLVSIAMVSITLFQLHQAVISRSEASNEVFFAAERHYHLRVIVHSLLSAGSVSSTAEESAEWQDRALNSLHLVEKIQHTLLFGGSLKASLYDDDFEVLGEQVLPGSSKRYAPRQRLMFEDACELLNGAEKKEMCKTGSNGLFAKGMQNGITEFLTRAHSVLRTVQAFEWPRTPQDALAFSRSEDMVFITDVVSNTLLDLSEVASRMYTDELLARLAKFHSTNETLLVSFFVVTSLVVLVLGGRVIIALNQSIKRNRTLLLNLPPDAMTGYAKNFLIANENSL